MLRGCDYLYDNHIEEFIFLNNTKKKKNFNDKLKASSIS